MISAHERDDKRGGTRPGQTNIRPSPLAPLRRSLKQPSPPNLRPSHPGAPWGAAPTAALITHPPPNGPPMEHLWGTAPNSGFHTPPLRPKALPWNTFEAQPQTVALLPRSPVQRPSSFARRSVRTQRASPVLDA
jgi:hypothetical protein